MIEVLCYSNLKKYHWITSFGKCRDDDSWNGEPVFTRLVRMCAAELWVRHGETFFCPFQSSVPRGQGTQSIWKVNKNSNFSLLQGLFYSVLSCGVRGQCPCCYRPRFQQRSECLHYTEKRTSGSVMFYKGEMLAYVWKHKNLNSYNCHKTEREFSM